MAALARGSLRKMVARLERPVQYSLPIGDERVPLNARIGQRLRLSFPGEIHCIYCGRATNKSYNQGYCYRCFQTLARCDSCIIHPERCHYHRGTCREPEWGEQFCMHDHIVYLANSSGVKVGITRASQVPTRWVDQGAVQALAIVRVRSRQQSGLLEVAMRQHVSDRTNWRDMLRNQTGEVDLTAEKDRLLAECRDDVDDLRQRFGPHSINVLNGVEQVRIDYPVRAYPEAIRSFNPDREGEVEGTLLGIKGQYLIFDTGVINMRRYAGYTMELEE